ncbi:TIGR03016 family PEP-CTERM system-associated outer membrane protein [Desulfuromonas sp. KJ2020]|uniref:TIGR03016 family PEP-CTERM system-associated outer membrane protein n=1 Tax=Desulfuromonas sp. KJ2020 TaxID=2919173 RepID=UPI0020A7B094|nr:TIGR03016 family PEP-CTERM system-associated outer membrane protein [Desulfuromonas sp. KJ2020]MCP3178155.1 TIGR03016 family PEP-CTERM system-associated outer membrane protein [Desulfuromonas sp. KJ2020]
MKRSIFIRSAALGCLLALTFASVAWGRVDISPRFTLREEYNDNVYLSAHNEQGDFITRAIPGLSLELDSNYLDLSLDYSLHYIFYADLTEENESSLKDVQRAMGTAQILPDRDFTVTLEDHYSRVTIDERDPVVEESLFVNRTNLNRFLANPRYQYRALPGLLAIIGYRFEKLSYQAPEGDDSEAHAGYVDVRKDLSTRFSLLLYYEYREHQARITEDYARQDGWVGLEYRLSPRLTLRGHGGQSWINYDDRAEEKTNLWAASLDYTISSYWAVGASYSQEVVNSVTEGLFERKSATVYASRHSGVLFELEGHAGQDRYQETNRQDDVIGGSLSVGMPLVRNTLLRLTGAYDYLEYEPERERVHRYGGGPALEYAAQRFSASLGYRYREENSNIDSGDYVNHIAFVEGSFEF